MGMATWPHCSKRHRAEDLSKPRTMAQAGASPSATRAMGSCPAWMICGQVSRGSLQEMEADSNVTREDSSQTDSSQEDSSHLPQGRLHHPGCGKSRGGRTPWCILSLPRRLYPGAAAPSALLSIPACVDRARDSQPQGHTQLQTFLSPPGSTL